MLSRVSVETGGRLMTVFAVPGGNVRVACRAISQADVGVLLLDPSPVEFDASLSKKGKAAEHLLLAKTMGVKEVTIFRTFFFHFCFTLFS